MMAGGEKLGVPARSCANRKFYKRVSRLAGRQFLKPTVWDTSHLFFRKIRGGNRKQRRSNAP